MERDSDLVARIFFAFFNVFLAMLFSFALSSEAVSLGTNEIWVVGWLRQTRAFLIWRR